MPAEVVSYFLKNKNLQLRLGFQVILRCAPFLKGLKVANAISIREELCGELERLFDGMKISWRILSRKEGKCLILFYRPEELEEHLNRPEYRKILHEYGYVYEGLDGMLDNLSRRIQAFKGKDWGFPHELGVFLGYPAEDVAGFIENSGDRYLFIGYWKVYNNPSIAQKTFKKYDQAVECAVNEFISGKSFREIVQEA